MRLSYQQQGLSGNVGSGDSGDLYVGYDRFGRTVKMPWYQGSGGSQTTLEEVEYGFDRAGARQWKQRPVASNGGQDEFYNYDGLHQVSGYARGDVNINRTAIGGVPVEQEGFEYDPSGNWRGYQRWVEGEQVLEQSREHNQDNQLVQMDGSSSGISYDLSGNATLLPPREGGEWSGSYQLKWDAWNRLVKVSLEDETEVGRYEYDGQHRRNKRVAGGVTRTCLYNDQWKLVEQWGDVAGYHEQYVWGTRHRDELILRDRDTDGNGSMDERLLMLHDYYSPLAVANSSGTVLERYGYSAFGNRRVMDGSFEPRSGSSYDLEYAFQGQFRDSETGFYNYGYRYYSPDLGRWLNRDPIGERGGFNLYGMVGNQPVNLVDYLGLSATVAVLPFAGGAAAADGLLPIGDAIAVVAIVAAGAWDLSQPGPGTGRCSRIYHGILQGAVNAAKLEVGLLGKCKANDCCWLLYVKAGAWLKLATARSIINTTCFDGGDDGHQQAAATAWEKLGECAQIIQGKCND